MPDIYLLSTHASTFWRYFQQPTRFGVLQRNVLRDWLAYKGILHSVSALLLLQLTPCAITGRGGGEAWLAYPVKALSEVNKLQGGLSLIGVKSRVRRCGILGCSLWLAKV